MLLQYAFEEKDKLAELGSGLHKAFGNIPERVYEWLHFAPVVVIIGIQLAQSWQNLFQEDIVAQKFGYAFENIPGTFPAIADILDTLVQFG